MTASPCQGLALVSMPWPPQNRPSVQLGALKAYLRRHCPQTRTDTFHPFLAVARKLGADAYNLLARDGWAGEAVASALLFPEHRSQAALLYSRHLGRKRPDFDRTVKAFQDFLENWLADGPAHGFHWQDYELAGFSVCFNQLLSSLLAASRLKARYPGIRLVFGGSACAGPLGLSLKKNFPFIDHVVHGEGEIPLLKLCRGSQNNSEATASLSKTLAGTQLPDLARLPPPDYDDFFREMSQTFGAQGMQVVLPLEFSRGCWWNRCAFCNLNLQWRGFRSKSAAQVLEELEHLAGRHACLDFIFCDNALPAAAARDFFKILAQGEKHYHFFAELRAPVAGEDLARMRRGGLTVIQVGIEALSDSLLRKMGKGTRVAQNLAIMKDAAACGMALEGNLIIEFPDSSADEVRETLAVLELVLPYRPLSTAVFFLGHGSPVDRDLAGHGISARRPHPDNQRLFPRGVLDSLLLLVNDYRADRVRQRKIWRPVAQKVKDWQRFHAERRPRPATPHALSWRDGGAFIQIRQELPGGQVLHHRLRGLSRQIYLYCDALKKLEDVRARFPSLPAERLQTFLAQLRDKRLLYFDDGFCLSLAIGEKRT